MEGGKSFRKPVEQYQMKTVWSEMMTVAQLKGLHELRYTQKVESVGLVTPYQGE